MNDDPIRLLELARTLAVEAGALLVDALGRPRTRVGTKSTTTDMVTEMDHASERLIVDEIRRLRPGDGVLSEEGAVRESSSGYRWVIDPIDGTTNYLYGVPGFAVSIAVEIGDETIVGVVHDPLHRDLFAAVRGGGAQLNGEPIRPSGTSDLATALVATGFGYDPERRGEQAAAVARLIGRIRDVRRVGAAAVDLCWVACGRVDAYYERHLSHWDLAAGALIAAEAGARLGAIESGPARPDSVLAASPGVFEPLRELLAEAGA